MILFSKRNKRNRRQIIRNSEGTMIRSDEDKFINDNLRNRIKELIKFFTETDDFLEPFLIAKIEKTGAFCLNPDKVNQLSMRVLGYEMTDFIDLVSFGYKNNETADSKLFDLVELLIIFSKTTHRKLFSDRVNGLFRDETAPYSIHDFMIISKESDGLRSIMPLIKEKNLRDKIKDYYSQRLTETSNQEFMARSSSEIIQLIFSSPNSQAKTKNYSEQLCQKVASIWTDTQKVKGLSNLISDTVKNAKLLSNQIENVRHTDRHTIPVDSPDFYKLISSINISIIELVILSLPELFILGQKPDELKRKYIDEFKVKNDEIYVIKNKGFWEIQNIDVINEIDPEDIPF